MTKEELYEIAKKASENAYAPYSKFCVGAAVLTSGGNVYTGVNIENASYPAGICAERSAFAAAVSNGEREFEAIAVAGSGGGAWPCGICRQFMIEIAPDITVITRGDDGLESENIKDLEPKGFTL